jgi:uncharacterized Zn-binding protein involved in type VI secretion
MGKPAARLTDMHVCPMVTPGLPPIPHVGGPITGPGCPTVLIGGMPAAVMGDMCVCVGPPDTIILGSVGVMIGGKPAARMGDSCAHGGTIVLGCPTVLIGEVGSGGGGAAVLGGSADQVAASPAIKKPEQVVAILNNAALAEAAAAGDGLAPKASEKDITAQFTLIDDAEKPVSDVEYEIETSDGTIHTGKTDSSGKTAVITGVTAAQCQVRFKK